MSKSEYFVDEHSIVREIWGKSDTILFIFAGASAEFALNKAVDWLYYTGRLPTDPIGRLFSTVSYARKIVFSNKETAKKAILAIATIHANVETKRGAKIPDWAYRDVLFMLIDYSVRAFEVLERKLNVDEKQDIFDVFYRLGKGMGLTSLPQSFEKWEISRLRHMKQDLQYSKYTGDLYRQYRQQLGWMRYYLLLETQRLLVPLEVGKFLRFKRPSLLRPMIIMYKFSKNLRLDWLMRKFLLPPNYKNEIKQLDHPQIG